MPLNRFWMSGKEFKMAENGFGKVIYCLVCKRCNHSLMRYKNMTDFSGKGKKNTLPKWCSDNYVPYFDKVNCCNKAEAWKCGLMCVWDKDPLNLTGAHHKQQLCNTWVSGVDPEALVPEATQKDEAVVGSDDETLRADLNALIQQVWDLTTMTAHVTGWRGDK